jgi:hypothetical protein
MLWNGRYALHPGKSLEHFTRTLQKVALLDAAKRVNLAQNQPLRNIRKL